MLWYSRLPEEDCIALCKLNGGRLKLLIESGASMPQNHEPIGNDRKAIEKDQTAKANEKNSSYQNAFTEYSQVVDPVAYLRRFLERRLAKKEWQRLRDKEARAMLQKRFCDKYNINMTDVYFPSLVNMINNLSAGLDEQIIASLEGTQLQKKSYNIPGMDYVMIKGDQEEVFQCNPNITTPAEYDMSDDEANMNIPPKMRFKRGVCKPGKESQNRADRPDRSGMLVDNAVPAKNCFDFLLNDDEAEPIRVHITPGRSTAILGSEVERHGKQKANSYNSSNTGNHGASKKVVHFNDSTSHAEFDIQSQRLETNIGRKSKSLFQNLKKTAVKKPLKTILKLPKPKRRSSSISSSHSSSFSLFSSSAASSSTASSLPSSSGAKCPVSHKANMDRLILYTGDPQIVDQQLQVKFYDKMYEAPTVPLESAYASSQSQLSHMEQSSSILYTPQHVVQNNLQHAPHYVSQCGSEHAPQYAPQYHPQEYIYVPRHLSPQYTAHQPHDYMTYEVCRPDLTSQRPRYISQYVPALLPYRGPESHPQDTLSYLLSN